MNGEFGMTDKRFTSNNGVFYTDNETGWEFQCYGEVVDLLNELNEDKEYWRERAKVRLNRTKEAHAYFDCLEKAIEQVCSDDIQEIIWNKYDELENGLEE